MLPGYMFQPSGHFPTYSEKGIQGWLNKFVMLYISDWAIYNIQSRFKLHIYSQQYYNFPDFKNLPLLLFYSQGKTYALLPPFGS